MYTFKNIEKKTDWLQTFEQ